MNQLPLFLKFQETVVGDGFAAGIRFDMRVLAEVDDSMVWIYGVNPGAIAASGPDLTTALCDLRRRLRMYLYDVATDYTDFATFRAEIIRFFKEDSQASDWEAARAAIRAGDTPETGQLLHRETRERRPRVEILQLQLKPSQNLRPEEEAPPAMAA